MEHKKATILLVEDNPDDKMLTLRAIRRSRLRCQVVVVHDGIEAMDYLGGTGAYAGRDANELPDLVLLDLKLPKLDGLQVLRNLRGYPPTRRLPVVVLTSDSEQRDLVDSYVLGANSYIVKPVNFPKFAAAVRQVGLRWMELNKSSVGRSVSV